MIGNRAVENDSITLVTVTELVYDPTSKFLLEFSDISQIFITS